MKALIYARHGGPEVLDLVELPDPTPGPLDVVVQVAACATNRLDVIQRAGHFTLPGFDLPHVAGMDMAGEVVAVGGDVDAWSDGVRVGDRVVVDPSMCGAPAGATYAGRGDLYGDLGVIGANLPGGYAELCLVPATHVHHLVDDLPYETAAAAPTAYATAWHALFSVGELEPGEVVVVHGAAGGVGSAAIQLAVHGGATVLATGRGQQKLDWVQSLGATGGCDSREVDVSRWVADETGGRGADLVVDLVGPALWEESLRSLRPRGRLVFLANTTGDDVSFSLSAAYSRGLRLLGSDAYRPEEFAAMLPVAMGPGMTSLVTERHLLADAAEAHRRLEDGDVVGKQVLLP